MFIITNPQTRPVPDAPHDHPVLSRCPHTVWSATRSSGKILRTVQMPGGEPVTDIITSAPGPELAGKIAEVMQQLTANPALNLEPLATAAGGQAIDIARLARHIVETGSDPWQLRCGTTALLVDLSTMIADLPTPVRRALLDPVYEVVDQFGPVLVAGTVEYYTAGDDEPTTERYEMSRLLNAGDTTFGEPMLDLADLSWIDRSAQERYDDCQNPDEDHTWSYSDQDLAAFAAWRRLHGLTEPRD